MLYCVTLLADNLDFAAITADKAVAINDTTLLMVRDGDNFIKLAYNRLPATITYLPDTAFGPLPAFVQDGVDTLDATAVFAGCAMGWQCEVETADQWGIITIAAHENAAVLIAPQGCPSDADTVATAWDKIMWNGREYTESGDYPVTMEADGCEYIYTLHLTVHKSIYDTIQQQACDSFYIGGVKYTQTGYYAVDTVPLDNGDRQINLIHLQINETKYSEDKVIQSLPYTAPSGKTYSVSGDYKDTTLMANGCYSILTLHLTIESGEPGEMVYDTVYYCEGFNTPHEERYKGVVRRFMPYAYESPVQVDFMDGVLIKGEPDRSLLDLRQAEKNLYAYYVDPLMPIQSIAWSVRYSGTNSYVALMVTDEPQWVNAGVVAVRIHFLCGKVYTTDITTDVIAPNDRQQVVKYLENGNVVIMREGMKYNVLGTRIR